MSKPPQSPFKSGFVALIGPPNAGKSTLLNALLKFPLSIVSPKPQTTRHKLVGILNGKGWQLCLLDTPGWLERAEDKLQDALIHATHGAVRQDADIIVLLVAPSPPAPETLAGLGRLAARGKPLILAVNKVDKAGLRKAESVAALYAKELPVSGTHILSALKGDGVDALLTAIVKSLPESPAYYGTDQLSDRWERFFAAEIVREEIFNQYHEEIPHASAVVLEEFRERAGRKDSIRVTVYVERPPQKAILIGKNGKAISELRKASLKAIEAFLGRRAELEIWVKVRKNWRKDPRSIKEFGYTSRVS
ncbi:MAG: GTPase Era [Elusimicrobiota bacterium]